MPRVIHFEILADNPERTAEFYRKVFDWKIEKEDLIDYWLVTTGEKGEPGINGGIMKRLFKGTTINTVDVRSIDESTSKIGRAGGKVIQPKRAVTGVGYVAYCADTEGNLFGIIQQDPEAH